MDTSTSIFCGPCESRHVTSIATVWCPNCEEGICEECLEYHKVSKSSSLHKTISIESYLNLPKFMHEIKQICTIHDKNLELYCGLHQTPCCMNCITADHAQCPGITSLKKVVDGVKESAFYQSVQNRVRDMTAYLAELKENRTENVKRIQQQKVQLKEKVKSLRAKIDVHLDTLEREAVEEIEMKIEDETTKINQILLDINKQLSRLDEKQKQISNIAEHGTELQVFLGFKHLEDAISEDEQSVESLVHRVGMSESNADFEGSEKLNDIVFTAESLGMVGIANSNLQLKLSLAKSQYAQIIRKNRSTIDDIQCIHKQPILHEIPKEKINVCSCVVLPDGRLILGNNMPYDSKVGLIVFSKNGKYEKNVEMSSNVFGLALINSQLFAASFQKEKCIKIYDTNRLEFQYIIADGYFNCGLSRVGERIASAVKGTGVVFMDLYGTTLKILPVNTEHVNYIHVSGEKLYYTNFRKDIIGCVNTDGEHLWETSFENTRGPRNICTDTFGNVFVAARDSNTITAVSSDGKSCKKLISFTDGIKEPKVVYFEDSKSMLVVVNKDGTGVIYNIVYQ